MIPVILFVVCILASSVGAVVGAGGGVIIKPVLDMIGILPVSTVSFCSGCTVLGMSISSLIRNRNNGVKLKIKTSTALALGAVCGGFVGQWLFDFVRNGFSNEHILGGIQAMVLTAINFFVFIYVCKKNQLPSKQIDSILVSVGIGIFLGMISAFLGIGGGPLNVAVLFFFFSMDAKEAAKNSLYIIIFSQISSIGTALATGSVPEFSWLNLCSMVIGGVGGALIGAAISKRIDNTGVEKILKILLLVLIVIGFYNVLKYMVF